MSIIKQVQANFPTIASNNANGSITGLNIIDLTTTGNVNLGAVANVHVTGGTRNQILSTDGAGNLSWTNAGITTANVAWVDTGWRATQNFPPAGSGFNFVFAGTGNLAGIIPAGTQVRFRPTGPIYTVSFILPLVANSRYRVGFTTATTETITTSDPLLIIGEGLATSIIAGEGIIFTPNANASSLTISTDPSEIVNGSSNVRIPTANGNVVFSVNGTNNTATLSNAVFSLSRGVSNVSAQADEFIRLGSNTAASNVVLGINSANTQYSGIRLSKAGAERYFIGTDTSTANGNFVVNNPNSFYSSSSLRMTEAGITYRIPPLLYYTSTASQSVANGTDFSPAVNLSAVGTTKYSSTVTESQFGISYNSGSKIWTFNTSGVYQITFTVTFASNSVGGRTAWLADNSGTVLSRMAVPAVTSPLVNGITVTAQAFMASGSQLTINVNQNSGGSLNIGGIAGYPTTLSIVRL